MPARPASHSRRLAAPVLVAGAASLGLLWFRPHPSPGPSATDVVISSPHSHPPTNARFGEAITPPPISVIATPSASTVAIALALAERDLFEEALIVAKTLPADQRTTAVVSVFSAWTHRAPADAASHALTLPTDAERNLVWHAVVTAWAGDAPAELAAFAWGLPDETARGAAFAAALPAWLARDEAAALAWIGALPAARQTDSAVALVARHAPLIERDPELALAWAEVIRDPALRSRTLGEVIRAWLPADPPAAAHYARTAPGLSPSEREDILVGERFTAHP